MVCHLACFDRGQCCKLTFTCRVQVEVECTSEKTSQWRRRASSTYRIPGQNLVEDSVSESFQVGFVAGFSMRAALASCDFWLNIPEVSPMSLARRCLGQNDGGLRRPRGHTECESSTDGRLSVGFDLSNGLLHTGESRWSHWRFLAVYVRNEIAHRLRIRSSAIGVGR